MSRDMHFGIYKSVWYCRWCGIQYKPKEQTDKDGFCKPAHKQALHRALRKYNARALRLTESRGKRPGRARNTKRKRKRKK